MPETVRANRDKIEDAILTQLISPILKHGPQSVTAPLASILELVLLIARLI
jgi:hypothetical protein